jgi:molybdopterin-binding protein
MRLSARNKIDATVTSITRGEAIANVVQDAGGIRLVASITAEAAAELGLAQGSAVAAIIKASDVIIGVPDLPQPRPVHAGCWWLGQQVSDRGAQPRHPRLCGLPGTGQRAAR